MTNTVHGAVVCICFVCLFVGGEKKTRILQSKRWLVFDVVSRREESRIESKRQGLKKLDADTKRLKRHENITPKLVYKLPDTKLRPPVNRLK